jgi:hypothetical protein
MNTVCMVILSVRFAKNISLRICIVESIFPALQAWYARSSYLSGLGIPPIFNLSPWPQQGHTLQQPSLCSAGHLRGISRYCIGVQITPQLPHFVKHFTGTDKVADFALSSDKDVVVARHPRRLLYHCSSYTELDDGSSYSKLTDEEPTKFGAYGERESLRSSYLADVVESTIATGSQGGNTVTAQYEVCETGRRWGGTRGGRRWVRRGMQRPVRTTGVAQM